MSEIRLQSEGFGWDEAKLLKNAEKHRVSPAECEQVFFHQPLVTGAEVKHSKRDQRYFALGRTDAGRRLFLVLTVRRKLIRVISARNMSRKERGVYESS